MKKTLQYALFLGLAAGLMWYVFKDIPLNELLKTFRQADYTWVILSALLAVVAHWSRAARWTMLMEPMGYRPSVFNATLAVWIGYFANFIVPRLGEVSRCGSLQRTDGVPFEKSFGTVVAERVFDVLTLLVLIGLNLLLEFDRLSGFFADFFGSKLKGDGGGNAWLPWLLLGGAVGSLCLVLVVVFNKPLRQRLLRNPLAQKVAGFLQGLLDGVLSIRRLRNPALFLGHTALIWTMYYLMSYVLFFSIPETRHLTMLAGLTILVVGAIGNSAPTQGGIGAFHVLVGNVAVLYGLSQKDGIVLATFIHGTQMITMLIGGALAFVVTLFLRKRAARGEKQQVTA
jgi:uncharacterized membrane protein YbhN (UPF0104 family)